MAHKAATTPPTLIRNGLLGAAGAILSLIEGVFLPFVSFDASHVANVIWGFTYGFGWFVIALLVGDVRSPDIALFGSTIWPLLVVLMMAWVFARTLRMRPARRNAILAITLISFVVVLPENIIFRSPLKYIPTYSRILFVVY